MRHSRANATSLIVIVSSFACRPDPLVPAGEIPGRTSDAGSGRCLRAAEPFVETDAAEARLAQRHQRDWRPSNANTSERDLFPREVLREPGFGKTHYEHITSALPPKAA